MMCNRTINRTARRYEGAKPNYLYIILKGICVVKKQPNRTEMLFQKLSVAKEKANEFDSKYIFDHRLCSVLNMTNVKEEFKVGNIDQADLNATLADFKKNPNCVLRNSHITLSEVDPYKLQLEINKLKSLIASAEIEDERERSIDLFNNASASKKFSNIAASRSQPRRAGFRRKSSRDCLHPVAANLRRSVHHRS